MAIFIGTAANDTLVGTSDADTLTGLGGDDSLAGKQGADVLEGGEGDDRLIGGAGDDQLDGGAGFDYAVYDDATSAVSVDLTIASAQATGGGGTDTLKNIEGLVGSNFADRLIGDGDANTLFGGYGDDTLMGGGGADILDGGQGADLLDGGDGFDFADYSSVSSSGVTVDLSLTGSQGFQGQNDTLLNIEGVIGSSFSDILKAGRNGSTLHGGAGGDALYGGVGDDTLYGGDGNDLFYIGVGADKVDGGAGNDTLHLIAGAAGLTADFRLVWGGGIATVNGAAVSGIEALGAITASNQGDTIIVGAGYADRVTLDGLDGADTLMGGSGSDLIYGGLGRDTIDGGAGDDYLFIDFDDLLVEGGAGKDLVLFERNTFGFTAINVDLSGLWGGGSGYINSLELRGVEKFEAFKTSNANDTVRVGAGVADVGLVVDLGAGDDVAYGGAGMDSFAGGDGADTLYGGGGSDGLSGGLGRDRLYGEDGNDRLVMGDGDVVDGGAGFDTIAFSLDRDGDGMNLDLRAVWGGGVGTFNGGTVVNVENILDVHGTNANDVLMIGDGVIPQIDYGAYAGREVFYGQIIRGYSGDDTIVGSGGGDKIYGDHGSDRLSGGAGDDLIVMDGDDTIDGGAGSDTLSFGGWWFRPSQAINIDLRPNWDGVIDAKIKNIERIGDAYGSDLADRIIIGERYTVGVGINAGDGDDYIIGSGGNDGLEGWGGNDTLNGGSGDDILLGGQGDDFLEGAAGNDIAQFGGASTDYSWSMGADGLVTVRDLRAIPYDGVDTLKNIEILLFSDKSVTLSGTTGITVTGSPAADKLTGSANNDVLRGEGGDDVLEGLAGDDILDGGAGFDVVSFASSLGPVTVVLGQTLQQNTGMGLDQFISIEGVIGSAYGDRITGSSLADKLDGGGGDDWIFGADGDDMIDGGEGRDTVEYMGRSTTYSWTHSADGSWVVKDLLGIMQAGTDTLRNVEVLKFEDKTVTLSVPSGLITGGDGADALSGSAGNDIIRAGGGADVISSSAGDDVYDGGSGYDYVFFSDSKRGISIDLMISGPQDTGEGLDTFIDIESIGGTRYDDVLRGDNGYNDLQGYGGADIIDGRGGDDNLSGHDGDDIVRGGDGNDLMSGGAGNDQLFGENGDDTIVVSGGAEAVGSDLIDGGAGFDTLWFSFDTGVTVDLGRTDGQQIASNGWLTIRNIENLHGSAHADRLTGNNAYNVFQGWNGNDVIDGGGGIDTVVMRGFVRDFAITWTQDGWIVADKRPAVVPTSGVEYDGVDTLRNIEFAIFYDKFVTLGDGMVFAGDQILRTTTGQAAPLVADLSARLAAATINRSQAIKAIVDAADATTSVASMSYQFFTGKVPTALGVDFLISPTGGNSGNLNSELYAKFNTVNRYINFAMNLGKFGEAKDSFAAAYGSLTLFEATKKAYGVIFGATPNDAKVAQLLDGRVDFLASFSGDPAEGIGTKAAMVGFLLAAAATENVGVIARSNDAWLTDLADGSAPFAVNLIDPANGYYKADFIYGA